MGIKPPTLKTMTWWEYAACLHGWNKNHGKRHSVENEPMSDEQYEALCDLGDMWSNGAEHKPTS